MTMDITLQFNGRMICLPGVTRFTTCDDVIEMVLYRSSQTADSFCIYEHSYDIERRLPGKESIAKIVRSWGADKKKFDLVIRQTENGKVNVARRKLQGMKLHQKQRCEAISEVSATNTNLNKDSKKEMKPKVIPVLAKGSGVRKNRGKIDLMKRFLKDVMSQQDKQTTCVVKSRLPLRTLGDGCSDSESDKEFAFRDSAMDTVNDPESAFEDDSDSSICDFERNILEHDVESDIDSLENMDSVINKVDSTELKCEKIRMMFGGFDITNSGTDTDDANMESFMRTLVHDTDSDEGRGTSVSE